MEAEILKQALVQAPGLVILVVLMVIVFKHQRAEAELNREHQAREAEIHRQTISALFKQHADARSDLARIIERNTQALTRTCETTEQHTSAVHELTQVLHRHLERQ